MANGPLGIAILTGVTAGGQTVTALRLEGVSSIDWRFRDSMIRVTYGQPDKTFEMSLTGVTTVTDVVAAGVHTVTVS